MSQIALRWLIQQDTVSSVIIGVKTLEQLEDNMGAAKGWELTKKQVSYYAVHFQGLLSIPNHEFRGTGLV